MNRRGFLSFLAKAGIAAAAIPYLPKSVEAASVVPEIAAATTSYESFVFKRAPGFFNVITYTGNGGTQVIQNTLGGDASKVIIKCRSPVSDWYVLDMGGDAITLPEAQNLPGREYIAYEFGAQAVTQVGHHIEALRTT